MLLLKVGITDGVVVFVDDFGVGGGVGVGVAVGVGGAGCLFLPGRCAIAAWIAVQESRAFRQHSEVVKFRNMQGAHGVVVSHPLRMRKALGSNPSVSICSSSTTGSYDSFSVRNSIGERQGFEQLHRRVQGLHLGQRTSCSDSCGVRTHALSDWRLKPAP